MFPAGYRLHSKTIAGILAGLDAEASRRQYLFVLRSSDFRDDRLNAALRSRLDSPVSEVALTVAHVRLRHDPEDPDAARRLRELAQLPTNPAPWFEAPLSVQVAQELLATSHGKEFALSTLRSRLSNADPREMIAVARLLVDNGRPEGVLEALNRRAGELEDDTESLLAAVDLARRIPGDRSPLASALDHGVKECLRSPSSCAAFLALAQRQALLSGLDPSLLAALDAELEKGSVQAQVAYARIVLLSAREPEVQMVSRLLAKLISLRAERSTPYRQTVGRALAILLSNPRISSATVQSAQTDLEGLRRSHASHHRTAAEEILQTIEVYRAAPPEELLSASGPGR